jgi:uroporphyrinogen decarboxylase
MPMTSRERFICAAQHKEADRVPVDFCTTRSGGITAVAYNALKKYLGIASHNTMLYDIQQQLAYPDDELMRKFGLDLYDVGRAFLNAESDWKPYSLMDGSSAVIPAYYRLEKEPDGKEYLFTKKGTRVAVKPPTSYYFDQCYWPWGDRESIPDPIPRDNFEEEIWMVPASPNHLDFVHDKSDLEVLRRTVKELYETTTYALYIDLGRPGFFEKGWYMFGAEKWFMSLVLDKPGVCRMLDAYVEECIERLGVILEAVGDYIQVIRVFHDDIGNQNGPQFSPALFKEIIAPRYRRLFDFIHSKSRVKILNHSCGSIADFIPSFIDAGLDMLNPIQTSCNNMDPARLKKEYGKDLVLWGGGIDTVNELTNGTPAQVRDRVRERIEIFAPGGGFVFCATHNIQPEVPPQNVAAMLEAAGEYGVYG